MSLVLGLLGCGEASGVWGKAINKVGCCSYIKIHGNIHIIIHLVTDC